MNPRILALLGVPPSVIERWTSPDASGRSFPLSNAVAADGEVLLYGPIVPQLEEAIFSDWFGDDVVVSNASFRERLNAIEGDVLVRIDSPGGDVWGASGIMNAITERRGKGDQVNTIVDGLAASAATLVMLATGNVRVAPMASVMIYQASGGMYGTADEFRTMADFLDSMNRQAAGLYAARMDVDEAEALTQMKEERWLSGEEAVEAGLADEQVQLPGPGARRNNVEQLFERRQMALNALAGALA